MRARGLVTSPIRFPHMFYHLLRIVVLFPFLKNHRLHCKSIVTTRKMLLLPQQNSCRITTQMQMSANLVCCIEQLATFDISRTYLFELMGSKPNFSLIKNSQIKCITESTNWFPKRIYQQITKQDNWADRLDLFNFRDNL